MADVTATTGSLSSTESSNSPSGSTNVGTGMDDNLRMIQAHLAAFRDQTGWGTPLLTSVSGTNTITAALAAAGSVTFGPTVYPTGMRFLLIPAATNTGATTLNVTSPNGGSALGAKNVFCNGVACGGGELVIGVPAILVYDGTQFNIIGERGSVIGVEVTSTSGTTIDFTGIPTWAKLIEIGFSGVSVSGATPIDIRIGDAGGAETSGYLGCVVQITNGVAPTTELPTGSWRTSSASAAAVYNGNVTLARHSGDGTKWTCKGILFRSDAAVIDIFGGEKTLSPGPLDRVRILTDDGTSTFDAGSVNIVYF